MGENLSYETVNGMSNLGFDRITNALVKGDSYFNVFFSWETHFIITMVKSPREVKDVWLITVFDRGKNKSFDLNTMEGINVDALGRANFPREEDIIPFVEKLLEKIKEGLYRR